MKEAKWKLSNGKLIPFEEIYKKAATIKKIKLELAGNEFIADAKKRELIVNGQVNHFGFDFENPAGLPVECKIDCIKRTQKTLKEGTNEVIGTKVFYLVGLLVTIGDDKYQRYVVATDDDKKEHEFQIISQK